MKTWLTSFATVEFFPSLERLSTSARRFSIDVERIYTREDLRQTLFYQIHRPILDLPRGAGYWLWKPWIILKTLEEMDEGDVLLYVDAGAELIADPSPLLDRALSDPQGVALFWLYYDNLVAPGPTINSQWTKRDCFILMGCDEPEYHQCRQVNAAFQVYRKCSAAVAFAAEVLFWAEQPHVITDVSNVCGQPNLPDFVDHRHDQSILSLVAQRRGASRWRDPSQFGNHVKPEHLRVPGEDLTQPYSDAPALGSEYRQIFHHHRHRYDRLPLFRPEQLQSAVDFNRATLKEVPSWITDETYERSFFRYGLPEHVRGLIDRDIGGEVTYTDLLIHLATRLGEPVRYLELGVSVGKNLYQVSQALDGAEIVGWDIEDISPSLRERLGEAHELGRWPAQPGFMRPTDATWTRYGDPHGANQIEYVAADLFDPRPWEALAGRRFNVIFSDALHTPTAIWHEYERLKELDLISTGSFLMMWDDLGAEMTDTFLRIWDDLRGPRGLSFRNARLGLARGWLGENEYPHLIGLIYAFPGL